MLDLSISVLVALIAIILPTITLVLGYALGVREERRHYEDYDALREQYVTQLLDDLDESVRLNSDLLGSMSRHPGGRHLTVVSE